MEASSRGSSKPPSGGSGPGPSVELRPFSPADRPISPADRPISPADRGAIERILRATGAFRDDEIDVALELIDAPVEAGYRFVVAEIGGVVAGYACFGETPMTRGTFDLYWLAVDPARQRSGIGRRLLRAAEAAARAEGGRILLVETAGKPSYAPTRAAYEACGYSEVARIPDFYDEGDDKIVYARRLDRPEGYALGSTPG